MDAHAPSSDAADSDTAVWDQYWRDGRLASCGGEGRSGYQAAIADGWRAFFAALAPGSRILDACAGNGAVARIAEEVAIAGGVLFDIDAFDSARIAPVQENSSIRFQARVRAESTPYPAGVFDAVVGQYAIEYTALERTLPELKRVSRPSGRVRFVVHAREGIVVAGARQQLEDVRRFHETGDIFSAARELARARAAGSGSPRQEEFAARVRTCLENLHAASQRSTDPVMFRDVADVIVHALHAQRRSGTEAVLHKIDEAAETVDAHEGRLSAMYRAALDEAGAIRLAERVSELWRRPAQTGRVQKPDGGLLGWSIETTSRSAGGGSPP